MRNKSFVLEQLGYKDEGWRVDSMNMLECEHAYKVEDDGSCPEGCVSPLKQEGMI